MNPITFYNYDENTIRNILSRFTLAEKTLRGATGLDRFDCALISALLNSQLEAVPVDKKFRSFSEDNYYLKNDLTDCIHELMRPDVRGYVCMHTSLSLDDISYITDSLVQYRNSIPFSDIVGYVSLDCGLKFHLLQKRVYDMSLLPLPYIKHPISNVLKELNFVTIHYKIRPINATDISRTESDAHYNTGFCNVAIWFEVWGAGPLLYGNCQRFETCMDGCGLPISQEAVRKLSLGMDAFMILDGSVISRDHWYNVVLPDIKPFHRKQHRLLPEKAESIDEPTPADRFINPFNGREHVLLNEDSDEEVDDARQ